MKKIELWQNILMEAVSCKDKMLGCLYGQAIGDALGLGSEFMTKDEVVRHYPKRLMRYDQIIQDAHRKRWVQGAWTDDTDMMLYILAGYENDNFNIQRIASNFKKWSETDPLGIGTHISKVLGMSDYEADPELCSRLWWELSNYQSAANGALMRTSVVGLPFRQDVEETERLCKLTHYDPRCVGSCVVATRIIHNLIWEKRELTKEEIVEIGNRYDSRIKEWIERAYDSIDISLLELDEPYSIGYTLRTLSAALWCYWHSGSFEDGLLAVVNEGGDADTNAAIACAILGAKFGYSSIPRYYIDNLHNKSEYEEKIEAFVSCVMPH